MCRFETGGEKGDLARRVRVLFRWKGLDCGGVTLDKDVVITAREAKPRERCGVWGGGDANRSGEGLAVLEGIALLRKVKQELEEGLINPEPGPAGVLRDVKLVGVGG